MIELDFSDSDGCDLDYVRPTTFYPHRQPRASAHIPGTPCIHELATTTEHAEKGALCHRVRCLDRTLRGLLLRLSVSNT